MSAFDLLSQKNGLKTTKTVLGKQQSGVDAAQKANPQQLTFTMGQLNAMKTDIDKQNAAVPKDETPAMKAAREKTIATQQAIAKGVNVNQGAAPDEDDKPTVPIVKKEVPKPQPEQPKRMSYADMFKAIYGNNEDETPEQKARREKREKTRMRIAAIGDGLRALSNMYFATKGAKVVHDSNSDMTPRMMQRKQMIDSQREKNKSAWLNGYLKAQALDEEARKNNMTIAEQMRYHDMIDENNKDKNDLSQQRIDLSRYRINSLNDYNDRKLQIDKDYKDGLLSEKAHSNAIAQLNADANMLRAQKSGNGKGGSSSSSRKGNYSGNVEDYITLKQNDPKGMAEAEAEARKMGYSPKTASGKAAARIIYQRKHGKTTETVKPANKGTSKGGSSKGSSSKNGGKKSTGVKW